MTENGDARINRRAFLGGAGAGFLIVKPETVRGSAANSAIRLGLLGCGGRGTTVATSFATNTTARVVALADMFADQLEKAKGHFDKIGASKGYASIDRKLMFRGPKAYQEIAASNAIDMVQISTPDWFHPQHLEAVVAAGKHVYCEKPVAVDVPGAKRIQRIGEKAQGRLSLDIGFQLRSAPPFAEIVRRIHEGAIGKVAHVSAHYHAPAINYPARPKMSRNELRLRNWYWDRIISGDVMVDQNIHVIDICNWVLRAHPLKANGTGGRKVRKDFGNIWDHWAVNFTYPDEVLVSFNSVQFGDILWDVTERFFGSAGVAESPYSGPVQIISAKPWRWDGPEAKSGTTGAFSVTGEFFGNLANADREKDRAFIDSIVTGKFHNQAATGAESALSAMLGRMAAYTGRTVTWDELMRSEEVYDPGLNLTEFA